MTFKPPPRQSAAAVAGIRAAFVSLWLASLALQVRAVVQWPLWFDEAQFLVLARGAASALDGLVLLHGSVSSLLFYRLLPIAAVPPWLDRLLPLCWSLAAPAYALWRWRSPRGTLFAFALLANPLRFLAGVEARPYGGMLAAATVAFVEFARAGATGIDAGGRRRMLAGLLLAPLFHPSAAIFGAALLVVASWRRMVGGAARLLGAAGLSATIILQWALGHTDMGALQRAALDRVHHHFAWPTLDQWTDAFGFFVWFPRVWLWPLTLVLLLLPLLARRSPRQREPWLWFVLATMTVAATLVACVVMEYPLFTRLFLAAQLPVLALLAAGLERACRGRLAPALTSIVAVALVWGYGLARADIRPSQPSISLAERVRELPAGAILELSAADAYFWHCLLLRPLLDRQVEGPTLSVVWRPTGGDADDVVTPRLAQHLLHAGGAVAWLSATDPAAQNAGAPRFSYTPLAARRLDICRAAPNDICLSALFAPQAAAAAARRWESLAIQPLPAAPAGAAD